jgi:hypothetical protein
MKKLSALLFVVILVVVALAPAAAPAAATAPRLVGTPALTYTIASNASNGRFVSIGATVRLDRPFASRTEQHRYSLVAAPRLHTGQRLADALFGGTALGRVRNRPGATYQAEAVQLKRRRTVAKGARWRVALARNGVIVGVVKTVTLRRA